MKYLNANNRKTNKTDETIFIPEQKAKGNCWTCVENIDVFIYSTWSVN